MFCLFIFATVYSAALIFVYLIKMDIYLSMQKRLRKLWDNKYSKIFAYLFLHVFFLYIYFCTFN